MEITSDRRIVTVRLPGSKTLDDDRGRLIRPTLAVVTFDAAGQLAQVRLEGPLVTRVGRDHERASGTLTLDPDPLGQSTGRAGWHRLAVDAAELAECTSSRRPLSADVAARIAELHRHTLYDKYHRATTDRSAAVSAWCNMCGTRTGEDLMCSTMVALSTLDGAG